MLLTPQVFPQLPNWPTFGAFFVSPFVSAFAMVGQLCMPAASPEAVSPRLTCRLWELVNGWPKMSNLRPDNSNPRDPNS
jgi:hypothetical protein